MPSRIHEAVVQLVREQPIMVAELLNRILGVALPAFASVRVESCDLSQLKPTEYRADAVVALLDAAGQPLVAMVVEVQLSCDVDKRYSWPAYLATLRARWRCDTLLVVIACDAKTARWCAAGIRMGHPDWVLKPLVIGPEAIPVVTEPEQADQQPWLAVLSSLAHHDHDDRESVLRTLLETVDSLEADQAELYIEVALVGLPDKARECLEKLMETETYRFKSDFARRHYGRGFAEGESVGEAKGEANAIITVLTTRGLGIPARARRRILDCVDTGQLNTWLQRAVSVPRVDDLFT